MSVPLPPFTTAQDATSFSHTVGPWLHQLSLAHVLPLLNRTVSPTDWYFTTNPVITAILVSLALSVFFFLLQLVTRNSSQVDRAWSILPPLYIAHFTAYAHYALDNVETDRLDSALVFSIIWGARLTFNFWRRGGYSYGHEDYRHAVIQQRLFAQPWYTLYSAVFLALYQNVLLAALTFPAYILLLLSYNPTPMPFITGDKFFTQGLVVLVLLETLADHQQYSFQTAKAQYKATGVVPQGFHAEDLDRGFCVSGLWAMSRHPNFVCEQAIWVVLYQWTCWQTDVMYHWAGAGVAGLLAVFQGSVWLTEKLTAEKYPEYKEYQKVVPKFFPGYKQLKKDFGLDAPSGPTAPIPVKRD